MWVCYFPFCAKQLNLQRSIEVDMLVTTSDTFTTHKYSFFMFAVSRVQGSNLGSKTSYRKQDFCYITQFLQEYVMLITYN